MALIGSMLLGACWGFIFEVSRRAAGESESATIAENRRRDVDDMGGPLKQPSMRFVNGL
jgi:hypothetical protein